MTPNYSNLSDSDKALLDSVINKVEISDGGGLNVDSRDIGPNAEKVLVYRDTDGKIIRQLEPEGQTTPIVIGSIEGAASTLDKLEEKDTSIQNKIKQVEGMLVTSIENTNIASVKHNAGDYFIYNNSVANATPKIVQALVNIQVSDPIIEGTNVSESVVLTTEIANMKVAFQAGVDEIYKACRTAGITPASSAPKDIRDAILQAASGTATASDVLSGKTFLAGNQQRNGNIVTKTGQVGIGTPNRNSKTVNVTVPKGYYTGNSNAYITCDGNTIYKQGEEDKENELYQPWFIGRYNLGYEDKRNVDKTHVNNSTSIVTNAEKISNRTSDTTIKRWAEAIVSQFNNLARAINS